ncbi:MAG TPA: hypothetical protein VIJ42_14590 [Stellaceae bacterium]
MDYFESVVVGYLRANRALFVNTEYCIQLNATANPDTSGPHWYCDALICDFRAKAVFLGETSFNKNLGDKKNGLVARLRAGNENWQGVLNALRRDSFLPPEWPVRPWLFIPEGLIPLLLRRLEEMRPLEFVPRVTTLEKVQPWLYPSWNRQEEAIKLDIIPPDMRV